MPQRAREAQGRLTAVVRLVHIGTAVEQKTHYVRMPAAARDEQRRVAILVRMLDIDAAVEQKVNDFDVAIVNCDVQR